MDCDPLFSTEFIFDFKLEFVWIYFHKQDVTQGQFFSEVKWIWFQSFPSYGLVA